MTIASGDGVWGVRVRGAWSVLMAGVVLGVGGQATSADDAVTPAAEQGEVADAEDGDAVGDLQLRYAMARLKLAELDLQRAVTLNKPTPNAIGALEITRLTNHVRLMQRQVEIAQGKPQSSAREVGFAAAELACETAQADLDAARAANKRAEGAVKKVNMQRLETKLEIAQIRLQLYKNPDFVPSPIDEMQWHIDQLTEQLIDLRHRVETRSSNDFGNME